MASTSTATGLHSGKDFKAHQINNSACYAEMTSEPLVDAHDNLLAAVRHKKTPYFRHLSDSKLQLLPRDERSVRHNEVIQQLLSLLSAATTDVSIFTYVFEDDGTESKYEQTLFAMNRSADFRWYAESQIQFDDFTYIQPDLCGRDTSRMAPTRTRPGIIIEVIDSHFPEPETFEKLMELSRCSYHVYFLVMGEFRLHHAQKLYKFPIQKNCPFRLRSAWALINGELVKNGVAQTLTSTDPALRAAEALDRFTRASNNSR